MAYNGGAMLAMRGDECVTIAADKRYGIQMQTVATNFQKIFEMGPHLYVGLPGLATDTQTVMERLRFRKNIYELKENRRMSPEVMASMVSNMLYEKRFGPYFVEPIVAGLEPDSYLPFICNMDLIGCINKPRDFVVGGTASAQLYGMCESVYEPNLGPEDLFETTAQALMNAFDRDAGSGWGATVYIM